MMYCVAFARWVFTLFDLRGWEREERREWGRGGGEEERGSSSTPRAAATNAGFPPPPKLRFPRKQHTLTSTVQTGPNAESGGVRTLFFKVRYQTFFWRRRERLRRRGRGR